jgi:ABC-type transport system involved in Fe-S cluster assembly fused permease/ATPase subunit
MVSSMVFHVLPTALEISMVCGILVSLFNLIWYVWIIK